MAGGDLKETYVGCAMETTILSTVATGKGCIVKIYQSFNKMATHVLLSMNINI
jgi:hypothetical protein